MASEGVVIRVMMVVHAARQLLILVNVSAPYRYVKNGKTGWLQMWTMELKRTENETC